LRLNDDEGINVVMGCRGEYFPFDGRYHLWKKRGGKRVHLLLKRPKP
jgi:hypothetical protein